MSSIWPPPWSYRLHTPALLHVLSDDGQRTLLISQASLHNFRNKSTGCSFSASLFLCNKMRHPGFMHSCHLPRCVVYVGLSEDVLTQQEWIYFSFHVAFLSLCLSIYLSISYLSLFMCLWVYWSLSLSLSLCMVCLQVRRQPISAWFLRPLYVMQRSNSGY